MTGAPHIKEMGALAQGKVTSLATRRGRGRIPALWHRKALNLPTVILSSANQGRSFLPVKFTGPLVTGGECKGNLQRENHVLHKREGLHVDSTLPPRPAPTSAPNAVTFPVRTLCPK